MGRNMRKPVLSSVVRIRLFESIISRLATSKYSIFQLVSVAKQAGIENPEDRFSRIEAHISHG